MTIPRRLDDDLLRPWHVALWFGTCAGVAAALGFLVFYGSAFHDDLPPRLTGVLALGGALAGWLLQRPVRRAVAEARRLRLALLGLAIAFLALELALTAVILVIPKDGTIPTLGLGLVMAPIVASPVLLIGGPSSGVGLLFFWRWVCRRRAAEVDEDLNLTRSS